MDIQRPAPQTTFPKDAKRVFQGQIFDVYQWKQKLFDGTEAVFEALRRPDTVSVIPITPEGKILIVHEEQPNKLPVICFPGGRVESDEDIEVAARRELREETGYEAGAMQLWFASQPVSKIDWAFFLLIAKQCVKKNDQRLDAGERITTEEISFDRFVTMCTQGIFGDDLAVRMLRATADAGTMAQLNQLFKPL